MAIRSKLFLISLVSIFISTVVVAEPSGRQRGGRRCGFEPRSPREMAMMEARVALAETFSPAVSAAAPINIPVVFHIIQSSDGGNEATSGKIAAQVSLLNSAYRGNFRFSTSAINTVVNDAWFELQLDSTETEAMVQALRVGDARTLNVYVHEPYIEEPSDVLGVASPPSDYREYPLYDGVYLHHTTLPGASQSRYNKGKTFVHEVGHWLGLLHTHQPPRPDSRISSTNNGCRGKGDRVADTPAERVPHFSCRVTDSCPQLPGLDPIRNFMSYTDDLCTRSFTSQQKKRMLTMYRLYRQP